VDEILCDHREEEHAGLAGFFRLVREVKTRSFDAALILRPTLRVALIAWLAGVGLRAGTAYRAYGFLFNRRIREHRRSGEKHELEYNLSLARAVDAENREAAPTMVISPEEDRAAQGLLDHWSVRPGERVVLIHPGSGGSARDWTPKGFAGLADRLLAEGIARVVLSAGPSDREVVEQVLSLMRGQPLTFPRPLSLRELAALIARCQLVVTNSTGPMHIATAVKTPVVALFSPIRSCSPQRWGPWGHGHQVVVPPVAACDSCVEQRCPHYDCMTLISEDQVFSLVRRSLDETCPSHDHTGSSAG
jgi:lipopolysaccharide heptosyltransferase II